MKNYLISIILFSVILFIIKGEVTLVWKSQEEDAKIFSSPITGIHQIDYVIPQDQQYTFNFWLHVPDMTGQQFDMIDANSEVFAIKDSNELFRDGVCVALEECPPRLRNLVNPYTEDLGDVCLLFRSQVDSPPRRLLPDTEEEYETFSSSFFNTWTLITIQVDSGNSFVSYSLNKSSTFTTLCDDTICDFTEFVFDANFILPTGTIDQLFVDDLRIYTGEFTEEDYANEIWCTDEQLASTNYGLPCGANPPETETPTSHSHLLHFSLILISIIISILL